MHLLNSTLGAYISVILVTNVEGGKRFVSKEILVMNDIGAFRSSSYLGVIRIHSYQKFIIFLSLISFVQ